MREREIEFDPVSSDARRERTERAVLSRLAAIQALGETDAVIASSPPRLRWVVGGLAAAAFAAVIALVIAGRGAHVEQIAESPSLVVTPVGGSSRFTVGDALIEAGGDTSIEVKRESGGGTALVLTRGSVDCDVTPRGGRAPFRVLAGDVTVEVIGTRFSVERSGATVRVDVTRGKVRVKSPVDDRVLQAGASWTSGVADRRESPAPGDDHASASNALPAAHDESAPVPAQPAAEEPVIEMPADEDTRRAPAPPRQSSRTAFASAQRLEPKDPVAAARAYRTIANGSDVWAALALYSLAEVRAAKDPASALQALDELDQRFPNGANAEDAAWLRVTVLRKLKRETDARKAAASYLRAYPSGTYVKAAERLASP